MDLEELVLWLEDQIKWESNLGDESLQLEKELGYPRVQSTGHYQRSVAYQKCLTKVKKLTEVTQRVTA